MGIIRLENMEFFAFHGHFKEEQIIGNRFRVDLTLKTNMQQAAKSDNLDDAADYQIAYQVVKKVMNQPVALLEHLAGKILNEIFNDLPTLEEACVKVSKLNPSMGGKMNAVSVEMVKRKNQEPE